MMIVHKNSSRESNIKQKRQIRQKYDLPKQLKIVYFKNQARKM